MTAMVQIVYGIYADTETNRYFAISTDPEDPTVDVIPITHEQFLLFMDAHHKVTEGIIAELHTHPQFFGTPLKEIIEGLEEM